MVFDLPLFRLEPTYQANPRIGSARNVSQSATANGGSKTTPYLGSSS
jgi:hypothetical protein